MQQKIAQKLYSLSFLFTTLTLCLTPLLFLPLLPWATNGLKIFVFSIGAFLSFIFWVLSQFSEGVIVFQRRRALGMLGVWQALLIVGVLFSTNSKLSMWGRGISTDSLIVLLSFSTLIFLVTQFASEKKKAVTLFFSFFSSLSFILVLQVLFTSLSFIPFIARTLDHVAVSGTLLGSWTDFSYFAVFLYGVALLTYEMYAPSRFLKKLSGALVVLSVITFLFLNIKLVWILVFVTTLVLFLYRMIYKSISSSEEEQGSVKFPTVPFVGLLISLFFLLSSPLVGGFFSRSVGFSFNDIRPSIATSVSVAQNSLMKAPLFGNGMGTYQDVWDLYKPLEINATAFWNTSFPAGFNYFLTGLATQGLLVLIAFVLFLASLIVLIKRVIQDRGEDAYTRWIRGVATFGTLFFIVLLFFHTPSIGLLALGAWVIGILLAVAPHKNERTHVINYLQDPRKSFFVLGGMLVMILAAFGIIFYTINLFIGSVLYSRAMRSAEGVLAINRLGTVVQINQNDVYHRVRASLLLSEFNSRTQSEDTDVVLVQNIYREAIDAANRSVVWHGGSSVNWLLLSQIYQLGATGENKELYEQAKKAGENARTRNPRNPVLELNLAQVALTQRNIDEAYAAIARAKEKKPDYIDAYLLRAQILVAEGQSDGFITELQAFLEKAPASSQGYALLAQAYADQNKYDEALRLILIAQQLEPTNISRFGVYVTFLERAGKKDIAIRELEAFKARFPEITGVEERIQELRNTPSSEVLAPEVTLEDDTN